MKLPLISVIVPIYNVENYLKQCLLSIVRQTYPNLEIICIYEENTSDISYEILQYFNKHCSRISIIKTKVKSLGGSRNIGLKVAQGEYITFIDSDDFIALSYIEDLYKALYINNSDLAVCKMLILNDKKQTFDTSSYYSNTKFSALQQNTSVDNIFKHLNNFNISVCNKIFKHKLIKQNNIYFPEGLSFEDNIFTIKYLYECKQGIAFIDSFLYFYRVGTNKSITNTSDNFKDIFSILNQLDDFLKEKNLWSKYFTSIIQYRASSILTWRYQKNTLANINYFKNLSKEVLKNSSYYSKGFVKRFEKYKLAYIKAKLMYQYKIKLLSSMFMSKLLIKFFMKSLFSIIVLCIFTLKLPFKVFFRSLKFK